LPCGVFERRSDFRERCEDEISLQHAGMRDLQFGQGDGFVAVEENVDVKQARALGELFFAAELLFDFAKGSQEIERCKGSFGFDHTVEKPGLVEKVEGFGFVKGRDFCYADGWGKRVDCAAQICRAVAEIRAERKINIFGMHCLQDSARKGWLKGRKELPEKQRQNPHPF